MGIFSKKRPPAPPPEPKACEHRWEDFDWYLEYEISRYSKSTHVSLRIIEPYVCIHCHERKNQVLYREERTFKTREDVMKYIKSIRDMYPQIKDRPIIEDEINDAQLVDREYINIARWLRGTGKNPREGGINALVK